MTDAAISPALAGRLAHEIRSPASVLLGALTHLEKDEGISPTSAQLVKLARRSCLRMERLSRRLDHLAVGEPQSRGPTPWTSAPGWVERAAAEASRASIDVSIEAMPQTGSMVGPAAHALEVAVDELVHNAVKHASSSVRVRVELRDACVRLEVRDDGPGIPGHLTGTAPSSENARRGGLGLGIDLVRAFSEGVGGTLVFESDVVSVEVPR